jgi:hypothetical protein
MGIGVTQRSKWLLLLPWGLAAYLFTPRYRLLPEDPTMSRIGRARAIIGVSMTLGIAVWYGAYSDLGLEAILQSLVLTAFLAIPSSLLCMAVVVALTRSGQRGAVLRQLTWPLRTMAMFAVALVGLLLFNAGGAGVLMQYDDRVPLSGHVAGGIFGLWGLIFVFRSAYLISQHWFNAADGHAYLQPLTAIWMAWVLAVSTLAFQPRDGSLPATVGLALPIISASVTTALAMLEGYRVRRALHAPPPSFAAPPPPGYGPYPPQHAPEPSWPDY